MACKVDQNKCVGCHTCMSGFCPMNAITMNTEGKAQIDVSKCINCHQCCSICPAMAIQPE